MERLFIPKEERDLAEEIFDDAGINYGWDSWNRLMIRSDEIDKATEALDEAGINYDFAY